MPLVPIYLVPGVCKSTTDYSSGKVGGPINGRMAQGRVTDCDHIRWVAGFPQTIGGWVEVEVSAMTGEPRASRQWRSAAGLALLGFGTSNHLYVFDGSTLTDITPAETSVTGSLMNAITTTNGSATVAIADNTQVLQDGDWVYLSAASAVGGVMVLGWYQVSARSGTGYNITVATAASSSAGPGGGSIDYEYPRFNLTNPFTTTSGSAVVSVADTAHGAATGDWVVFSGASAVGGLTLSGGYEITYVDPNTYTVTASSAASSSAGPGGGTVSTVYLVPVPSTTGTSSIAYGSGPYGVGPYQQGTFTPPFSIAGWTLASYGSLLLANPIGGSIYVYDPAAGGRAYPLLNAPSAVQAIIVTPERFVVALGVGNNLLRIAWSDQTDFTVWTATPTNTANEGRILQGGAYFVGGSAVINGASLILTDRACFQMLYTGDYLVYNTPVGSDNAGLISPWAVVEQGGTVYWMSDREFWMWNGSVQAMPSDDIRDYVFGNLNRTYIGKCFAALNRQFREVMFFYPSLSSTEIDSYVTWSITERCWSIGTMARTTWTDSELYPSPMACSADGVIYQQETGNDDNGAALSKTMFVSPVDISNGTLNLDIFGFVPDFQEQTGDLELNVLTRFYPEQDNTMTGPYTLADDGSTPRIDLRSDGKMAGFELESNTIGGSFRLALARFEAQPAGARR